MTVAFGLDGQRFVALNGGPDYTFSEAISFEVGCEDQDEVDSYWNTLSEGGEQGPCGWLKDKFGLSWQIVPRRLRRSPDPDTAKAQRVMGAMLQMRKIEIAELERAAEGAAGAIDICSTADAPGTYDGAMRYRREIEVEASPSRYSRTSSTSSTPRRWDPGIVEARRLSEGRPESAAGSRMIALFRSNRQRFEYVVTTALEEARRVALRGEGDRAVSDDEIHGDLGPGRPDTRRLRWPTCGSRACTGSPGRSSARPLGGWKPTTPSTGSAPGRLEARPGAPRVTASSSPSPRGGDASHRRDRARRRRLRERRAGRARRGNLEHLARVARAAARAAPPPRVRRGAVPREVVAAARTLRGGRARPCARQVPAHALLGFSMGGASRSRPRTSRPSARARTRALAPDRLPLGRCAAGVWPCFTDRSTGGCPAVPGVSPASSRAASSGRAGSASRAPTS